MEYASKKQFIIGTMIQKESGSSSDILSKCLIERFSNENRDVVMINLNDLDLNVPHKYIGNNMLDMVIFSPETFEKCKSIVQEIRESGNTRRITPLFVNVYDKENREESKRINSELASFGIRVYGAKAIEEVDCEMIPQSVEGRIYEREKELKKGPEVLEFAKDVVEKMKENKDEYTAEHLRCTSEIADLIAKKMGCSFVERDILRLGALVHDIGKDSISDDILKKKSNLDFDEYRKMKLHVICGQIEMDGYDFDAYDRIKNIVAQHHERADGKGYPNGLKSDEIDPLAKIVQVADAVHAMLGRSYKKGKTVEEVKEELLANSNPNNIGRFNENGKEIGCQFDPNVAQVLIGLIDEKEIDLEEYRVEKYVGDEDRANENQDKDSIQKSGDSR